MKSAKTEFIKNTNKLPSRFQITEKVKIEIEGELPITGIVKGVKFTFGKVKYDVKQENNIPSISLYEIDSCDVYPINS